MRTAQERMLDTWQEWYDNLLPYEPLCDCRPGKREECELCRVYEDDVDPKLDELEDFYV